MDRHSNFRRGQVQGLPGNSSGRHRPGPSRSSGGFWSQSVDPRGRRLFRVDKLYSEHIYWDQASVLVQIGLLDPMNLPIAGIETEKNLIDETLPSNGLMKRWAESATS